MNASTLCSSDLEVKVDFAEVGASVVHGGTVGDGAVVSYEGCGEILFANGVERKGVTRALVSELFGGSVTGVIFSLFFLLRCCLRVLLDAMHTAQFGSKTA